ncbi:N-6 DNA methylase [Brachymonas chironomi]|uniref:N-6 DNA methylase n=1 Tax=Brachymonas chironomi TaxID=491919 RepID=UPI00036765A7|nr:N-6 DNA methylase [Brachymonas chironomi]
MAKAKSKTPLTTRDNLSALIGSARKILRKDKGLNGDVDRLPLLTWVMFLKFLDDLEFKHEQEAALDGKRYQPIIEAPYRWRDWAAREDGITGDELLDFIGQERTHRADGSVGQGLFAYLRALAGQGEKGSQREVIANVFKGVQNRMVSGYLLRDIVNKINGIHFNASEEIHTLSHLYESMLREMRDAAGDSGEFYTPRPVVRFMVQVTNPHLSDTVLDPACGTGGFLVEAFDHLNAQVTTTEQRRTLQRDTLAGQEAKPLPYMLAQMNLLLHGLEAPQIAYGNTLERRITEIGHDERVDVILTNPPFGGEEEAGIKANFPPNMQTAETALLFLQYIMRKLRVAGAPVKGKKAAVHGGRAAVVVPNGTLFGDGVAAVIKAELLKEFKLHTIVRLPQGVFAPYTDIPANLLFFERGGPTETIWYYELPLPEGRKKYSKTAPLQFDEFAPVLAWWNARKENAQAWQVSAADIAASGYNLDRKNPNARRSLEDVAPSEVIERIFKREDEISRLFTTTDVNLSFGIGDDSTLLRLRSLAKKIQVIKENLESIETDGDLLLAVSFRDAIANAPLRPMSEVAPLVRREVAIDLEVSYTELGVRSFYKGTFHRRTVAGSEFTWQKMFRVEEGDLIFSNIMAWEQGIALAKSEDHGCVGNHRMLTCVADRAKAVPGFLAYYFMTDEGFAKVYAASPGTAARNRTLIATNLEAIEVPVPPLPIQQSFVRLQAEVTALKAKHAAIRTANAALLPATLERVFSSPTP